MAGVHTAANTLRKTQADSFRVREHDNNSVSLRQDNNTPQRRVEALQEKAP